MVQEHPVKTEAWQQQAQLTQVAAVVQKIQVVQEVLQVVVV